MKSEHGPFSRQKPAEIKTPARGSVGVDVVVALVGSVRGTSAWLA